MPEESDRHWDTHDGEKDPDPAWNHGVFVVGSARVPAIAPAVLPLANPVGDGCAVAAAAVDASG